MQVASPRQLQIRALFRNGTRFSGSSLVSVSLNACSAIVVEKLSEYFQYKSTYENVPAKEDIPDFFERVPPEIVLELCVLLSHFECAYLPSSPSLIAADYFESKVASRYCGLC